MIIGEVPVGLLQTAVPIFVVTQYTVCFIVSRSNTADFVPITVGLPQCSRRTLFRLYGHVNCFSQWSTESQTSDHLSSSSAGK